jgi:hypothetical protein
VATFGVALASAYLAPEAHALVIDLSSNLPGDLTYSAFFTATTVDLLGGASPDFTQYNDAFGKSIYATGDIAGWALALPGSTIDANTLVNVTVTTYPIFTAASGPGTLAFRTTSNQPGWLRLDPGGPGGAIEYLGAAFNNDPGSNIVAGEFRAIPEPGSALASLGLLALGAAGVRRHRAKQRAADTA